MKIKDLSILILFVLVVITIAEFIGFQSFTIAGLTFNFLPLVFALVITMGLGIKAFRHGLIQKIYSESNIHFSSNYMIIIMLPLLARYGADVAPKLHEILSIGWVFLLQELGNLGTVLIGLPIAILLGLRQEAIGSTLGIGREGELAYISEKYTLDSPQGRGVLSQYIFGTLFGAMFYSIVAPIFLNLGFSIESLSMASGVGSASMMAAASSSLTATIPDHADTISAYASASQLLTSFLGTFTMLFLAVPLQRRLYKLLTRKDPDHE